jgi:hypothetical protein
MALIEPARSHVELRGEDSNLRCQDQNLECSRYTTPERPRSLRARFRPVPACEHTFAMPRYTEQEARIAIAASHSYAETLRRVGLRPAGGNHALFRKYVDEVWRISTDHFDPYHASRTGQRRHKPRPLSEILIEGSSYPRAKLKARLYQEGLSSRSASSAGRGRSGRVGACR